MEEANKVAVDLGCGATRRCPDGYRCIGIDCYDSFSPKPEIVCRLGFENIPLEDDSVDMVVAYDFLEHLPAVVYYKEDGKWAVHYPRIFLLGEVHRILKVGGIFESYTPDITHRSWAQDPTHCSPPFTDETWNYFCGGYCQGEEGNPYGIDFAFEMVEIGHDEIGRLHVKVRKPNK